MERFMGVRLDSIKEGSSRRPSRDSDYLRAKELYFVLASIE